MAEIVFYGLIEFVNCPFIGALVFNAAVLDSSLELGLHGCGPTSVDVGPTRMTKLINTLIAVLQQDAERNESAAM